ncbi:UNVERIFIED_CONTAM: ABC transporter ATP-binding protein [Kocuria sp. CPCC 205316]|uniref:ABC transporter ATP-binding protein n=1 Tax=Kocuria TaxID=57493 RepID=UPI0036DB7C88
MTAPALRLQGVSKHYGSVRAVDRVSLEVRPGELYALLGLNGAGKTTVMRTVLGMVRPSAGAVTILGRGPGDRSVRAEVGYLVEAASAYPELTVRENLEVARRLRRLRSPTAVQDAVEVFGLREHADRRARVLSQGNLQRLALARAMLHRPSLLVLDEPVNGLDPAGVVEVRTLLERLAREHGTAVLLSSHILGEVARVATRIGVLHRGGLLDEFATAALPGRVRRHLELSTRDDARAVRVLAAAGFAARRGPRTVLLEDLRATDRPDDVSAALVHGGVPPTGLAVVREDLEAYFLRLVGARPPQERPGAR